MASFHPQSLVPFPKLNPTKPSVAKPPKFATFPRTHVRTSGNRARLVANSVAEEVDVLPVRSSDSTDHQEWMAAGASLEMGLEGTVAVELVGGFASSEGPQLSFDAFPASSGGGSSSSVVGKEEIEKLVDRSINSMIVLSAGSFAITKLLSIDHDYWHGWTIFEILRYAPQHNWSAYEEALKANPVLAKMVISGVVYSLGDWIAQCFEGKPLFEFDRARMFRSGLVGFTLHGSLSHYYYEFCEALFPFQDWWVVPAKVLFDQTAWAALWNSIYYTVVAFLRFESPVTIYTELKATFWPMLTAGWKLWPFAHLITYGVIPVEQRLLWVDCVELIWVTILSTFSNEKSEARVTEALAKAHSSPQSPSLSPLKEHPEAVSIGEMTGLILRVRAGYLG